MRDRIYCTDHPDLVDKESGEWLQQYRATTIIFIGSSDATARDESRK